jgi:hypothetical protein
LPRRAPGHAGTPLPPTLDPAGTGPNSDPGPRACAKRAWSRCRLEDSPCTSPTGWVSRSPSCPPPR